jgi:SAM-dependent methyltransferase
MSRSAAATDVMTAAEADDAARAVAARLPDSLLPDFSAAFIRSDDRHDAFVTRLALSVMREIGLESAAAAPASAAEIVARAGLHPERATTPVEWLLRRLASRGILEATGGAGEARRFRAPRPLPALDPAPLRDGQARENPAWLPSYTLSETVARDYPVFLRGHRTGEDVLFTPARLRLWSDFFSNDNPLYAVNNRVGAVAAMEWSPPGPATILELGGGLGSGATALVEALADARRLADVERYHFTDVVPVFLRRGQHALETRCADVKFFSFSTLDMNRPFAEQGVAAGSCSLVYGVNTLHVARDLGFTLGQVFDTLRPGGTLVISECIRPLPDDTVHAEFVFNLLEAFRAPVLHPAYRPNGGFLTPEQWHGAVEAAGFTDIRFLPDVARIRPAFPNFYVAAVGATRP